VVLLAPRFEGQPSATGQAEQPDSEFVHSHALSVANGHQ
jgi:hypothetical protein